MTLNQEHRAMNKYLEVWALLTDEGKFSSREECGIDMIYGMGYQEVGDIYEEVISYMEELEFKAPKDACFINVRMDNFVRQEGQMSFPETGQWDFPPYCEMDVTILGYGVKDGDQIKEIKV